MCEQATKNGVSNSYVNKLRIKLFQTKKKLIYPR